jgi:hypothetical protein
VDVRFPKLVRDQRIEQFSDLNRSALSLGRHQGDNRILRKLATARRIEVGAEKLFRELICPNEKAEGYKRFDLRVSPRENARR